jgi:hypothetical protein
MAASLVECLQSLHSLQKQSDTSKRDAIDGIISDVVQICLHEIGDKTKGVYAA